MEANNKPITIKVIIFQSILSFIFNSILNLSNPVYEVYNSSIERLLSLFLKIGAITQAKGAQSLVEGAWIDLAVTASHAMPAIVRGLDYRANP